MFARLFCIAYQTIEENGKCLLLCKTSSIKMVNILKNYFALFALYHARMANPVLKGFLQFKPGVPDTLAEIS